MKRVIASILILALACTLLNAQTVSVSDAQMKAASLNNSNRHRAQAVGGTKQVAPELVYTKTEQGSPIYYVFNYPQGGFAIIGGDECAKEILGYSMYGEFNIDSIPEGMKDMLGLYNSQISYAIQHSTDGAVSVKHKAAGMRRNAINPLLNTQWGQNAPFNNAIPSLGSNYKNFVTGCNATAAAQLMKYYGYPEKGSGHKQYTINYSTSEGTIPLVFGVNFENATYDWANMLDEYKSGSYSDVQADAVATLLYHVGVAMKMNYGQGASSSSTTAPGSALTEYFKYNKSAKMENRNYYSDDDWENMIYAELQKGHPVVYGGQSDDSGHAFVLHGYDELQGGYLINWGWNGYCDGYFPLTGTGALQPNGSGTGGAGDNAAYTGRQSAFIGLVPDPDGKGVYQPHIAIEYPIQFRDGTKQMTFDRAAETDKVISLSNIGFHNVGYASSEFNYGLMFEEQTTGMVYYSQLNTSKGSLNAGSYHTSNGFSLSFNTSTIPFNGTYDIKPVVRNAIEGSDWQMAYLEPSNSIPVINVINGKDAEPVGINFVISDNRVQVGKTLKITANQGYTGELIYTSSDESVATVDDNGVVTAKSVGNVSITVTGSATSLFKSTSKTFNIAVVAKIMHDVEIKINNTSLSVGETAKITCTNTYNGTLEYSSNNTSVASVDAEGNVRAVGIGTAEITVNAPETEDFNAAKETFVIYVVPTGFVFAKTPYINEANLMAPEEMKIYCAVKNNTNETLFGVGVYYKMIVESGYSSYTLTGSCTYEKLSAKSTGTFNFDLSGRLHLFTPGNTYTIYFYSDSERTKPMNIPSLTFAFCSPGDADGDGKTDKNDIQSVRDIILGNTAGTGKNMNSDLNFDGKVDIQDLILLIEKLKSPSAEN